MEKIEKTTAQLKALVIGELRSRGFNVDVSDLLIGGGGHDGWTARIGGMSNITRMAALDEITRDMNVAFALHGKPS